MSEVVTITDDDKNGSCLLFVKLKEEGEHLLAVTVTGQHVPNSPFLLRVNNITVFITTPTSSNQFR